MNVAELWQLALAHHIPYFIAGMLAIWYWPNLTDLWNKARGARSTSGSKRGQAEQVTNATPAEVRAQLHELQARQQDAARRLTALQSQRDLGNRQQEQP